MFHLQSHFKMFGSSIGGDTQIQIKTLMKYELNNQVFKMSVIMRKKDPPHRRYTYNKPI